MFAVAGAMFTKYKHKKGKSRMIWASNTLDKVFWGDEKKKNVKGFMLTTDLTGVQHGLGLLCVHCSCVLPAGAQGAKKPDNSFTVVSSQRTLELEAVSTQQKAKWMSAFEFLIDVAPRLP